MAIKEKNVHFNKEKVNSLVYAATLVDRCRRWVLLRGINIYFRFRGHEWLPMARDISFRRLISWDFLLPELQMNLTGYRILFVRYTVNQLES